MEKDVGVQRRRTKRDQHRRNDRSPIRISSCKDQPGDLLLSFSPLKYMLL